MNANQTKTPKVDPELKASASALRKQYRKGSKVLLSRKAYVGQIGTVQGVEILGHRPVVVVEITTTKTGKARKQIRTRRVGAEFLSHAPKASKQTAKAA
jgi:hypothetical protein